MTKLHERTSLCIASLFGGLDEEVEHVKIVLLDRHACVVDVALIFVSYPVIRLLDAKMRVTRSGLHFEDASLY